MAEHVVEVVKVGLPLSAHLFHVGFGLAQLGQRVGFGRYGLRLQISLALLQLCLGCVDRRFFLRFELQLQCAQHGFVLLAGQVRHLGARLDHLVGHRGVLHQEADIVVDTQGPHAACRIDLARGVILHRRIHRSGRRGFALKQHTTITGSTARGLHAFTAHGLLQHEILGRHGVDTCLLLRLCADLGCAVELLAQLLDGGLQLFELCVDVGVERLVGFVERRLFAALLDLCLEVSLLLLGSQIVLLHLQCVRSCLLFGFLGGGFFFGHSFVGHALLPDAGLLGFGCLGLGCAALDVTTGRGTNACQRGSADETVDVLLAGFRVRDAQTGLHSLQNLLCSLCQAFTAHGHTRLGGVIGRRFAQSLFCNGLGLGGGQFGPHGTEEFAHAGHQGHGGCVERCLRDGCGNRRTQTCLAQRLAGVHLTRQVGAGELPCRRQTCQTCCGQRSRSRSRKRQSAKPGNNRGGHVGDRAPGSLFELLPR